MPPGALLAVAVAMDHQPLSRFLRWAAPALASFVLIGCATRPPPKPSVLDRPDVLESMRLMGEMVLQTSLPGGVRLTPEVLHLVVGVVDHRHGQGAWPAVDSLPVTTGVEKVGPAEDGGAFLVELQRTQATGRAWRLRVLPDGTVVIELTPTRTTAPAI